MQGTTSSTHYPHTADSHHHIEVQGAREHNLKNVSVTLPKRRLTVEPAPTAATR
jgi:hypothetical protein